MQILLTIYELITVNITDKPVQLGVNIGKLMLFLQTSYLQYRKLNRLEC